MEMKITLALIVLGAFLLVAKKVVAHLEASKRITPEIADLIDSVIDGLRNAATAFSPAGQFPSTKQAIIETSVQVAKDKGLKVGAVQKIAEKANEVHAKGVPDHLAASEVRAKVVEVFGEKALRGIIKNINK